MADARNPLGFWRLTGRALLLRCPRCGHGGILRDWFHLKERCPTCGLLLDRGESSDYWLGAALFNLVAAELVSVIVAMTVVIALWPDVPWTAVEYGALALAIAMPLAFFPFARTIWLAWDLWFRPARPGDSEGRRGIQ